MAKRKKFSPEELSGFCSQVAGMLKSGIDLEEGMYMLAEEMEDQRTKELIKQVQNSLKDNESFSKALKGTGAFPAYLINMVGIGETSGKLEDVMRAMVRYYDREGVMRESIRNVIAYPMMMFLMIAVILVALVGKILPMFERVFVNLNVEAASASSRIMNFGMWTGRIVAIAALVVLVIGLGLYLFYQTEKGNHVLKRFVSKFFVTKNTSRLLAVGRLVSSLSVMVSSGMDTRESLELSKDIVEHEEVGDKVTCCLEQMDQEESFASAIREQKLLTGMQGRMIAIADKTGILDETLEDICTQYDEKISSHMGVLCTRLETSLVLGLSVVVGGVLISIMFPLVSIITSIG